MLLDGSSGAIADPFIASYFEEATDVHPQIQYERNVLELLTYILVLEYPFWKIN